MITHEQLARTSSLSLSQELFLAIFPFSASLFHFLPPRPVSMTTERAFSLPSLAEECISPNKKAFTRLIKRHCNAVCNAQFTHLILPLVLFNFIQNQSVRLSFLLPFMWTFLHLRRAHACPICWCRLHFEPFQWSPLPRRSSDRPFLLILSLDVANSGAEESGAIGEERI